MARYTLAPWAELVTDIPTPRNSDELMALPDDSGMYEMVEGRLVRMSPTNGGDSWLAVRLVAPIYTFVSERRLGLVTGADGGYVLSGPGEPMTAFAPDVAFIRAGRHPSIDSPDFRRIWPRRRQVDVWRPGSDSPVATLGEDDLLDGLDVLPGFTHPVRQLFG